MMISSTTKIYNCIFKTANQLESSWKLLLRNCNLQNDIRFLWVSNVVIRGFGVLGEQYH